jgi:predicted AAA+ superfamily ATPase
MSYINRPIYYKQIEPFIGDSLIKVIVGQRRVGKSNLLLQVKDEIVLRNPDAKIIYINKEDYKYDSINDYHDLMHYLELDVQSNQKIALFIDEIQEIQSFEKAIRSLQITGNFDIYCTGSNASLLSGELATLLAGRYIEIRVFSLTYLEYLEFHKKENSMVSLWSYMKFGGLPHLVNLREDEDVYLDYLKSIFDSIILRDVITRYNIRNIHFLQNLIRFIADNVGSLVSANKISDYLKSQKIPLLPKTILEYLSNLENVFFIERVKRKEVGGKKIFEIGEKFYFEDLGIRNAIKSFEIQDINKILENLVFHHLRCMRYEVFIGKMGDKEIDFIAQKKEVVIYIQVAYMLIEPKTIEREFGNLLQIKDNYRKMVITMDELPLSNQQGIEHWNVRKFLSEFN